MVVVKELRTVPYSRTRSGLKSSPKTRVVALPRVYETVKTVPVAQNKIKKKLVNKSFDFNEIFTDVLDSIKSVVNKPLVVLSIILVVAIVLTHSKSFDKGIVGKWVAEHKNSSTVAKWINDNNKKFLGMAIFVPTLMDLPKSVQVPVVVGTVIWTLLVPESGVYQYMVQAFCMHTFFKVKKSNSRIARYTEGISVSSLAERPG